SWRRSISITYQSIQTIYWTPRHAAATFKFVAAPLAPFLLFSRRRLLFRASERKKMNPLRTITMVAAALSAVMLTNLANPAPASASTLDDMMKAKVIKVAVPQDFAPFGSAGPDLKPVGYDIDMGNTIAEALGVKAEIVPVTSANRIPYLQTKKVDIVISSLGKNPEREKVIDFSDAYAPFFSGVYGTKDIAITKVEDLADKTVGATRGAIEEQELSKTIPASGTVKRYEDNNA